jgi:hypothetical protein
MTPAPETTAPSLSPHPNAPRDGAVPDRSAQTAAEHAEPDTAIPPGGSGAASPPVAPVAGGLAQTPAAAPLPPGAAAGHGPAGDVPGMSASPAGTTGLRGDAFLKAVRAEQSRQNAARRSGRGRYTRKADRAPGSGYAPGGNRRMPDGGDPQ